MSLRLTAEPTAEIVTLTEAKKHCRAEYHNDDDVYIQALIEAATANIDGPEGWLGRAVREQELELTIDRFPCATDVGRPGPVKIPMPTLISVDSLEYTATDGTTATVTDFREFGVGAPYGGYILPALSGSWPSVLGDAGSVRIAFTAGYSDIPKSIKHAVLLMVGHWYESREAVTEANMSDLPMGVSALLTPHRVW